jgi:hypothetical protein
MDMIGGMLRSTDYLHRVYILLYRAVYLDGMRICDDAWASRKDLKQGE